LVLVDVSDSDYSFVSIFLKDSVTLVLPYYEGRSLVLRTYWTEFQKQNSLWIA
jgi:hypothetical protein